uniref:C2 domain-containing protein n=1 Tax=Glossina brevipalpis TaxID=37001 RepID=A0A1A9WV98_9MUSC
MDDAPLTLTSIILMAFIVVVIIMLLYHYFGSREIFWSGSYREEKIGLSAHKLFKSNGYMIHSGSELLLSSSGSFKRFDTVDKESFKQAQNSPKHTTTPLWNLPQTDCLIPPQPLRPAPAPVTQLVNGQTKTVTFSFNQQNEMNSSASTASLSESDATTIMLSLNDLKGRNNANETMLIPTLEAPPKSRLSTSHSNNMRSSIPNVAIPRPVAKKSISSTHNGVTDLDGKREACITPESDKADLTTRTNTNPFLDTLLTEYVNKINSNTALNSSPIMEKITRASDGNPFISRTNLYCKDAIFEDQGIERPFRNRSFSETAEVTNDKEDITTISLNNITNAFHTPHANSSSGNPFTNVMKKVKGPHMLQKTISEDFLFRKIPQENFNVTNNTYAGTGTWSFGRLLKQEDLTFNLWRRNSSQCSLDSGNMGSLDSINLERAVSCGSVDSDLSTGLSNQDISQEQTAYTQITGYLCVGLHYDKNSITEDGMDLTVSVLEAKGLVLPFTVDSLETFVRIYLVPDQAGALQTKVVKKSHTPTFNETFNFWLKRQQTRHSLWFHLYHNGVAHTLIGEAEMEIGEMPRPVTTWIPLTDCRKCNARWGELMFSLSYLPTAERLTIVVVKARNLQLQMPSKEDASNLHNAQHIFVKVYLMNNEKKVLKKRTSLKRKDRCPVFNESVIFSLPPHNLTTAHIRLTMFGVINETTIIPIGHVVAGSCATGKGLRHWHQMLSSLRKPVAMWHVLRRGTNQPIFTGGADAVVAAMQTTAQRAKRNSMF